MDLVALCDEVANGTIAAVELPSDLFLFRYTAPHALTSEWAPALLVYPQRQAYTVETTEDVLVQEVPLTLSWVEDATYGAQHEVTNDDLAKAALQTSEAIGQHLQSYITGIPNLPGYYGVPDRVEFDLVEGGLWVAEFTLDVERLA